MSRAAVATLAGHELRLIEGTRQWYPMLMDDLAAARFEVLVETYILEPVGQTLAVLDALAATARRGVTVHLVVDGVGTAALPAPLAQRLADAGVQCRVYAPLGRLGLLVPSRWRRLHRKLVVVDGRVGYCGGINWLDDDHDPNHGPLPAPRLDYAVRICGPLVRDMHQTMRQLWQRMQAVRRLRDRQFVEAVAALRASHLPDPTDGPAVPTASGGARAALVLRDNLRHRRRIEREYLRAIAAAQHEVLVANAYFLPGRKLRRALVLAARRGVRVRLLLQGRYEYFWQYHAARPIQAMLLDCGVDIHEYEPSFLHAKAAVVDAGGVRPWATVGSSNLDPLSLLLAREANVVVRDAAFAAELRARLMAVIECQGRRLDAAALARRGLLTRGLDWLAYGLMRLALWLTGKRY